MSEQWFRDYVLLQFRIEKAIRKFTEYRFVDYYYGPSEWKEQVEVEAETPAIELLRTAIALANALPEQGFEPHRVVYLGEQVLALETVCRELNVDLPTHMGWLLDLVCHEGYPGHHREFILKEQHLYRERGYIEQSIAPIISPQSVISEGIATSAFEIIFTHDEAEQWAAEHLFAEADIEPVSGDMLKLSKAREFLSAIDGNATFMLNEGRSDEDVKQYLMKYKLLPDEHAHKSLEFLKSPFREAYVFTYYYGKQLMHSLLQGPNRYATFQRFLTQQICPSDLLDGWFAYQELEPHYENANRKLAE